jgi:hypothetical protein
MKKHIIIMMLMCCVVFVLGTTSVSAARFNESEAYAILSDGVWVDTSTGREVRFSRDTTFLHNNGYTDPSGESLIFFGNKGAEFKMYITYYPDQDKYYSRILGNMHGKGYELFSECSVRE